MDGCVLFSEWFEYGSPDTAGMAFCLDALLCPAVEPLNSSDKLLLKDPVSPVINISCPVQP